MLTHPTLDQLRALKLDGMAQAFAELEAQEEVRDLAHAEWLALLLDREAASRNTRRFQTRLRSARLRHSQAAIEDIDYSQCSFPVIQRGASSSRCSAEARSCGRSRRSQPATPRSRRTRAEHDHP